MVPFKPESLEQLKARFPKALEKVWEVTDPMPDRPGLHREHLFDFESGMRLLISKDKLIREEPEVHVSGSWEWNPPISIEQMRRVVGEGYRSLGGTGLLHFIGFSEAAIPHWIVREVN